MIEVKSKASKGDVAELLRMGQLCKKATNVEQNLAIVCGMIDSDAEELAKKVGIRIRSMA